MKYVLLLLLILSVSVSAQIATPDSLDKLALRNNRIINGHVVKLTSESVQFRESGTNLLYEFQKSEIKDLHLSNGSVMTFNSPADNSNVTGSAQPNVQQQGTKTGTGDNTVQQQPQQPQQPAQQGTNKTNEDLGGMSTTAILLLGAAGVVVLLLLGSAIF